MSIQSEIDRIHQNVIGTYGVLEEAGADMPSVLNTDNLTAAAMNIKTVLYGKEQELNQNQRKIARQNIGIDFTTNVKDYGAKGDGVTDDTAAFQTALAENRTVKVPGGTYILSDSLLISENCCLELSQDTVLKFVRSDVNCIEMQRIARLEGNRATIIVPYDFGCNVIHASGDVDEVLYDEYGEPMNTEVPPFTRWDPQWKMSRYISDINICKPDSRGFHYSVNGDCYGTAVYIKCDRNDPVAYMWGVDMHGLRIAGGFTYGINIVNKGTAWNHDMRIEAVIDGCETGVSVKNCNNVHLAVSIQPRPYYTKNNVYGPYAKYGIRLEDSLNADLSQSCVWDWTPANTLIGENSEYQHIAMYGNCAGAFIYDFSTATSNHFWQRIYYDNIVSMLNATVIGSKGIIPPDPKYAFYKNYRDSGYDFNMDNLSWRDPHNMVRYDVPVSPKNGWNNPNRLYRIGYFTIGSDCENPKTDNPDPLAVETITVEENNYFGICGWSNLFYDSGVMRHFWNPLPSVYENRVPLYFYSKSGDTYTIYRFVRDAHDIQHVYNCRVSITNARRFIFDFADMGAIGDLDTNTYIRINPQIHGGMPSIAGQYGSSGNKPYFCTYGAVYNADGSVKNGAVIKQLLSQEDIEKIKVKAEQTNFIITADGEYESVEDFMNVKSPYLEDIWNNQGSMVDVSNSIYIEPREFSAGDVVRIRGINFEPSYPGKPFAYIFRKSDGSYKGTINFGTLIAGSVAGITPNYEAAYEWDASTATLTLRFDAEGAAAMLNQYTYGFGGQYASGYNADSVIMTVNEEISYRDVWHGEPKRLDESIYAQNTFLRSPNGTGYRLIVNDDGTLGTESME